MEVILIEDVAKLGDMGHTVNVKPGYARNYLIPQKLALPASKGNRKQVEHQLQMIEARKKRRAAEAVELQAKVNGAAVTIARKANEETDKLFGSVGNRDIASALATAGHDVDHKKILIDNPLRELGIYTITIKLHASITAEVKVWVVAI
jgi:large subunit ribosomal protein L9